jgi:hypothetical protein
MKEQYLLSVYSLKNGALVRELWCDTMAEVNEHRTGWEETQEFETSVDTYYIHLETA